jgi:hypothetical protein
MAAEAPVVAEPVAAPVTHQPHVEPDAPVATPAPIVTEVSSPPAVSVAPAQESKAATPLEAPAIDPREYIASVGLQLVETRSDAVRAVEPEVETVKLGRPRRERPRTAAEESLVQVETQK